MQKFLFTKIGVKMQKFWCTKIRVQKISRPIVGVRLLYACKEFLKLREL